MTRVRVEPRSCVQGRRENDAFTLSATLPTAQTSCLECFSINLHNREFINRYIVTQIREG